MYCQVVVVWVWVWVCFVMVLTIYLLVTTLLLPAFPAWTFDVSPPFHYWVYFLSANLSSLNQFRATRNLTEFSFRSVIHDGRPLCTAVTLSCALATHPAGRMRVKLATSTTWWQRSSPPRA